MVQQVLTLARSTFTESLRQPIYVVLIGLGIGLLVLNPALSAFTFGEDDKMLLDLGLGTLLLCGLFLAAFTASGVLGREIERRTVLTVLSKPVGRPTFVIGKYLGVSAALLLAFAIWSLVFLMTVRHGVLATARDAVDVPVWVFGGAALFVAVAVAGIGDWLRRWRFSARLPWFLCIALAAAYVLLLLIDANWSYQPIGAEFARDDGRLVQVSLAVLLLLEALLVIGAIAVACSTRCGQVTTLVISLVVFLLGLSSDWLFGRFAADNALARIAYAIVPDFQFHWTADALTRDSPLTSSYVGRVSAYGALFIAALLCVATALFQTREAGR